MEIPDNAIRLEPFRIKPARAANLVTAGFVRSVPFLVASAMILIGLLMLGVWVRDIAPWVGLLYSVIFFAQWLRNYLVFSSVRFVTQEIAFANDAIYATDSMGNESKRAWPLFKRARKMFGHYYLYLVTRNILLVPISAVPESQVAALEELFRSKSLMR